MKKEEILKSLLDEIEQFCGGKDTHAPAFANRLYALFDQETAKLREEMEEYREKYTCNQHTVINQKSTITHLQSSLQAAEEKLRTEQELGRMRLAGISTAAIGYYKEGDEIHKDFDTVALRDVCQLYDKYQSLSSRVVELEEGIKEMQDEAWRNGVTSEYIHTKCKSLLKTK